MNKSSIHISIFIAFIALILLHEPMLIFFSNITSLFRESDKKEIDKRAYEIKIERLEKDLLEYETSLNNLKIFSNANYISGKLALREIYGFYDYIVIATDKKVNKNSAVINESGLVGITNSVDGLLANVTLLTKNSTSIKVRNSYGLMDEYDKKNKLFIVHNINNYENINVGDEVESSGLSLIDGGIKIGVVTKVETKGIERIVYVKPYVDFDKINYVYVIDKW